MKETRKKGGRRRQEGREEGKEKKIHENGSYFLVVKL